MIKLNDKEYQNLRVLHKQTKERRLADRIKAVILKHEGYSVAEIARILLLDSDSIGRYLKLYKKRGVKKLLGDNYKAYQGKLSEAEIESLKNDLRQCIFPTAIAVCHHVMKKYGKKYRAQSMVQLLKRIGFVYKKAKGIPAKANREKQEAFIKEYEELLKKLKNNEKIYFLDAMHPVHNAEPAYGWIEKGKEKSIRTNSGRDRLNINGIYSPNDQETIAREYKTINAETTLDLLNIAVKKHPELKRIYIIHDNARSNHSRWLKQNIPKSIVMVPLPSYSPNLNLIERLWKYYRKEVMANRYHETFKDFHQCTVRFFRNLRHHKKDLKNLMTERFHLIDAV